MPPRLLADIILIVHTAFIAFVVIGLLLVLLGAAMRWRWVRNRWFRGAHLACVGLVVFQQFQRIACPLTVWESQLRRSAGGPGYEQGFIAHWLHEIIFFDLPVWVFDVSYGTFGLLVVLSLWLAPIEWRKPRRPSHDPQHDASA